MRDCRFDKCRFVHDSKLSSWGMLITLRKSNYTLTSEGIHGCMKNKMAKNVRIVTLLTSSLMWEPTWSQIQNNMMH